MKTLSVCVCLASFEDEKVYASHFESCPIANRDVIKDINDGKTVSLLDEDDPLKMYMYGCSECSPMVIQEQLEAAARCMLNPSIDNVKNYDRIMSTFNEHLKTHGQETHEEPEQFHYISNCGLNFDDLDSLQKHGACCSKC